MWGIISTWSMSFDGNQIGGDILKKGGFAGDAVERLANNIESNPIFRSVGYGGLPNEDGVVDLDAGYMDGTTFEFGAVSSMRGFLHPISVARKLSKEHLNNYLCGDGAEKYALYHGFEQKNLLTEESKKLFLEKKKENQREQPMVYRGHDTVGIVALDVNGNICTGTSTSGLFMKAQGRVGDSPLIGDGFYCDSEVGGAAATGVGEEIMKGCLPHEIVLRMKSGEKAQEAADHALHNLQGRLTKIKGSAEDMSVIAMDKYGDFGISTTIGTFSFVVQKEGLKPRVYLAVPGEKTTFYPASKEWLDDYMARANRGELV